MEHVKLYQAAFPKVAEAVQRNLDEHFSAMAYAASNTEARRNLSGKAQAVVQAAVKEETARLDVLHSNFDKEVAHHLERHSCYRDVQRYANNVRL